MTRAGLFGRSPWAAPLWLCVWSTLWTASPAAAVDLVGCLPYYRMNGSYSTNMLPGQLAPLDEIRYFGLTINSSGAISTLDGASLAAHTNRIATVKQTIDALPAADRPGLYITLGGAGEAAAYAAVAAS